MPSYSIRLEETVVSRGHCDFSVEAPSEKEAAASVVHAYRQARSAGSEFIEMPNGQAGIIDLVEASTKTSRFFLLDAAGEILSELGIPDH